MQFQGVSKGAGLAQMRRWSRTLRYGSVPFFDVSGNYAAYSGC